MAHVLLPCDVPTWSEVERHLSQLRFAHSPEQLVADMQRIYDLCCVGLDPEDPPREEIRLDLLKRFLKSLSADESRRFFDSTLPALISCAMRLRELRPPGGFLYCLQQQDGMFALSRPFVASLLANSFFSTFPKRTSRTHPTLLDFNCSELFPFLDTACHCEKLRSLFAYFDCTFQDEPEGTVYFCRQVTATKNQMSLPEWMCSDCPLCPLMVRTRGLIEEAEPILLKCYPSSANVGNEFLGSNCTMECSVFLSCPEVLTALLFVELLGDNEALTVDGLLPLDPRPRVNGEPVFGPSECSVCLLDIKDHSSRPMAQFEDASLLRELNKCLVAFRQALTQRRPSPVGQSSSSSAAGHDPPCFHSLSSSKTSSSRSSAHATDSPPDNLQGLRGHEHFVDCKLPVADLLGTKTAVVSGGKADLPDPIKRCPQPENQVPTLAGVLGALRKKAEAQVAKSELPVPPPRSPRRFFKVLSSRSPSPTSPKPDSTRPQPTAETNSGALNTAAAPVPNIARPLATKPPPPASRRSLRSLGSSGSKGSVERNKSLENILSRISVSQPSTPSSSSSAPLLTQAVLCAQRHPSPRPDRRGSGSQAAMVFRPVNLSPLMSRRSAFRPATECLLDQRRQSGGGAPPIALPHCEFSALSKIKPACVKVAPVKVLTSPPVSSPRVQLSIESAPEDDVWRRQESVELESPGVGLPPSLLRRADAATTASDTDMWTLARQQQPAAEEGAPARSHRRTASGSSTTPFESPTANPSLLRLPSQKSCDDDYHTADESLEDSPEGHGIGLAGEARPRCLKSRRERSLRSHTSGGGGSSAFSSVSQRLSRDDSASSGGFVLDYRSDDDDYIASALSKHERYEDFRRRIRRRGRRLARRLSRSLRASYSSGSSDMDDIDEDPELGFTRSQAPVCSVRAANSEPTLHVLLPTKGSARELPALSIASELVMTSSPGRRQTLVMTTGQGMPKAYSFDGVNPNLPVPFKAKFRCKKTTAEVSHADSCAVGMTRQDTEFIKAHSFRPVSPDLSAGTSEEEDNVDSAPGEQEEEEQQDFDTASGDSEDRRRESFVSVEEEPPQNSEEPHPPPSPFPMRLSASGLRPVATCRWARDCVDPSGDAQLEALVQWIAASVAGVPGLVIYTGGQPSLEQLSQVSFKVEERHWTVGDLACETLRFCRNRVALHEGRNRSSIHPGTTLFSQLLGQNATAAATVPHQANAGKSGFRSSETCGDGDVRGVFQTHDSLE
uniref:poly(ADP-ribose) glycohydrolase n=1 Tax=Rhipicephalus appendiculatus TaxID=34631 RepID=A0A131YGQ9_RHIAP